MILGSEHKRNSPSEMEGNEMLQRAMKKENVRTFAVLKHRNTKQYSVRPVHMLAEMKDISKYKVVYMTSDNDKAQSVCAMRRLLQWEESDRSIEDADPEIYNSICFVQSRVNQFTHPQAAQDPKPVANGYDMSMTMGYLNSSDANDQTASQHWHTTSRQFLAPNAHEQFQPPYSSTPRPPRVDPPQMPSPMQQTMMPHHLAYAFSAPIGLMPAMAADFRMPPHAAFDQQAYHMNEHIQQQHVQPMELVHAHEAAQETREPPGPASVPQAAAEVAAVVDEPTTSAEESAVVTIDDDDVVEIDEPATRSLNIGEIDKDLLPEKRLVYLRDQSNVKAQNSNQRPENHFYCMLWKRIFPDQLHFRRKEVDQNKLNWIHVKVVQYYPEAMWVEVGSYGLKMAKKKEAKIKKEAAAALLQPKQEPTEASTSVARPESAATPTTAMPVKSAVPTPSTITRNQPKSNRGRDDDDEPSAKRNRLSLSERDANFDGMPSNEEIDEIFARSAQIAQPTGDGGGIARRHQYRYWREAVLYRMLWNRVLPGNSAYNRNLELPQVYFIRKTVNRLYPESNESKETSRFAEFDRLAEETIVAEEKMKQAAAPVNGGATPTTTVVRPKTGPINATPVATVAAATVPSATVPSATVPSATVPSATVPSSTVRSPAIPTRPAAFPTSTTVATIVKSEPPCGDLLEDIGNSYRNNL